MTGTTCNRSPDKRETARLWLVMKPRALRLTAVMCWLLTVARPAFGPPQQTPSAPSPATAEMDQPGFMLRVQSRVVVIDVTVKDRRGQPCQDLEQSDFQVFEDGKRQGIVAFEHHAFEPQAAAAAAVQLPKGEYSNIGIRAASVPAINIILFDVLNTPMAAQIYGRQQMVQFLKTLPPGQPTALFELGDVLKMLAGFTTSSDQLRAAAEKLLPYESPNFVSEQQAEAAAAQHNELARMAAGGIPGHPGATIPTPASLQVVDLGKFVEGYRSYGEGRRMLETEEAFETLAHVVAGYPGRKNILWLSAGFPLNFSPTKGLSQGSPLNLSPSIEPPERTVLLASSTAGMLASAQVVVYPIDLRALAVTGPSASTPSASLGGQPGGSGSLTTEKASRLASSQLTLEKIAQDTGGEAFYNTNDLKNAFQRAIEGGSNFYSLAYVPSDRNWNGEYRRIKVNVDRDGFELDYRRGYYATEWHPSPVEFEEDFSSAMQPGIPDSTLLPFKVAVAPADLVASVLNITYDIRAKDIAFQDSKSGRKLASIKLVAVAYTKDGKPDGVVSQLATLNLKPETYKQMLESGIRLRQQLQLQPGDDTLRVGVLDEVRGIFGTLSVPLPPAKP